MIEVKGLTVRAGGFRLEEVSFTVDRGEYGILMGRTGTGKTTLLEAVCGLKHVEKGVIELDGRDVTDLKPAERGVGFVPQDAALFSTMSVYEHLAFALRLRKKGKKEIGDRVEELAAMLGIGGLLKRKPFGLSGGEKQRVALGRALAARPGILCLDEPLSALDEDTRFEMYELLRSVQARTHVTTLHITHNLSETRTLADRLFVLEEGVLKERDVNGVEVGAGE